MHDLYIAEIYRPGAIFFAAQYVSVVIHFYTARPGKNYIG